MRFFAYIPALIALTCAFTAHAQQNFPTRPLRVIVFVPAGGGADLLARVMSQKLGDALGQTVVVDNRAGSGGVIATNLVAKAAPDGYTLLQAGITTHGIGPHVYSNLPYDPVKDFVPIVFSGTMPVFMMTHAQVPVKSVNELIALAKAKPNSISFGSPGTGSAPHLVGEMFKIATGIPSPHIPYKGSGTGAPAIAAGEVPLMFDAVAGHIAFIKSGRVRALAVTSAKRASQMPNVQTVQESGFPNFDVQSWYAVCTTAGTPAATLDKLNADIHSVLRTPEFQQRLSDLGIDVAPTSREELDQIIRAEIARWALVIKEAGIAQQ